MSGENLIASVEGRVDETVACEILFIKAYLFGLIIKTGGWGGENGSLPCFNPNRYWVCVCVLWTFSEKDSILLEDLSISLSDSSSDSGQPG